MRSWNNRNISGRSGELFSTALLLYKMKPQLRILILKEKGDSHKHHLHEEEMPFRQQSLLKTRYTDDESRAHVKGDNSSDLQPLGVKDCHGGW